MKNCISDECEVEIDRNKSKYRCNRRGSTTSQNDRRASFIDNTGIYTFCGYNRLNGFVFRVFGDYKKESETSKPNKPNP